MDLATSRADNLEFQAVADGQPSTIFVAGEHKRAGDDAAAPGGHKAAVSTARTLATASGRTSILLVDRDEQVRAAIAAELRDLGYQVAEAEDGAAAVCMSTRLV